MALQLSIDCNNTGLIADYWKISNVVRFDVSNKLCLVELLGYKDVEARNSGKNAAMPITLTIQGEAFDRVNDGQEGTIRSRLYTEIKLLPDWSNASDT